jgi:hypothetical protein
LQNSHLRLRSEDNKKEVGSIDTYFFSNALVCTVKLVGNTVIIQFIKHLCAQLPLLLILMLNLSDLTLKFHMVLMFVITNQLHRTEFLRNYRCSASLEIPCLLWNPKVHYHVHKSPPLVPILSHVNHVHTFPHFT